MLKLNTARKIEALKERRSSAYFFIVDLAIAIPILRRNVTGKSYLEAL
jgi:hypothetical protein